MKTFNVTITSRNKNSINDFLLFFNEDKLYNLNVIKKYFQKKIEKKKLTILKSPHVNKKAQEQFESRLFKKQLTIQTTKTLKYLIFLKRLGYDLFPDINIRLKYIINNEDVFKLGIKIFNPNYFKMNKYYNLKDNNLNLQRLNPFKRKPFLLKFSLVKKANYILKVFDLYGEFLKHMFE
jgi:ribosomal protein S10